jgi:hypothetical protein
LNETRKPTLRYWKQQLKKIPINSAGAGIAHWYSDGLCAGRSGFDSGQGKEILLYTAFRVALGPTQLPIQWVPGALSPGVKMPGREADNSPPFSAEVKNVGAVLPLPHTSSWSGA